MAVFAICLSSLPHSTLAALPSLPTEQLLPQKAQNTRHQWKCPSRRRGNGKGTALGCKTCGRRVFQTVPSAWTRSTFTGSPPPPPTAGSRLHSVAREKLQRDVRGSAEGSGPFAVTLPWPSLIRACSRMTVEWHAEFVFCFCI